MHQVTPNQLVACSVVVAEADSVVLVENQIRKRRKSIRLAVVVELVEPHQRQFSGVKLFSEDKVLE